MCGIVAYIGKKEAYPLVIKGLKRLEYRGYDSSGVALLKDGVLNVYKKKGKVVVQISNIEIPIIIKLYQKTMIFLKKILMK